MRKVIANQTFDEERSLYNLKNADVLNCDFKGLKDGESVLKETRNVKVEGCSFSLRYPLWHAKDFALISSQMDDKTRAPIWYAKKGAIEKTTINGIKALRESRDISVKDCTINSEEFGWKCSRIKVENTSLESQYLFFDSKDIEINKLNMKGKYSFQYIKNLKITDSVLDTKDAFWHSKNVTVENCVIKGEYLAWFSENLTLKHCTITGTQPFCYAKNLTLIDCTMEGCDLAFEYSSVNADLKGNIKSIKNPLSGTITVDGVEEIIEKEAVKRCTGKVVVRQK
ncbi:MAG: DUF3737 family protein [Bacilli bacterium]|jgi:hypothetical protein|nr:DUF3737 family protein [Bacilli bacterium]